MAIKVVICGMERAYDGSLPSWIKEQHCRRRREGDEFWFRIIIETNYVSLMFSSHTCPRPAGRPKPYTNELETRIADMWTDMSVGTRDDIEPLLHFLYKVNGMLT